MPVEPFLGQIMTVGFNFAPRGWALCDGQLLAIADNQALFSLLGTTYGGDGETTFALPDLRGRAAVHVGSGPGLTPHPQQGERFGVEQVTLTAQQMPVHSHTVQGNLVAATTNTPATTNSALAIASRPLYADDATPDLAISPVSSAGGSQPHSNIQPELGVYHVIAVAGIYPSRT